MGSANLKVFLSGGVANADPALSLGGAISSVEVLSQQASFIGSGITGVTLVDAGGNFDGVGELNYIALTKSLTWKSPLGLTPDPLFDKTTAGTDGEYFIINQAKSAGVRVIVSAASLPAINASDSVDVRSIVGNLFSPVTPENAKSGFTQYRCIYIQNIKASSMTLNFWIGQNMTAADSLAIGFATFSGGSIEEVIADQNADPINPVFYNNTIPNAQTLSLASGQYLGVWLRLKTPILSVGSDPIDFGTIIFSEV